MSDPESELKCIIVPVPLRQKVAVPVPQHWCQVLYSKQLLKHKKTETESGMERWSKLIVLLLEAKWKDGDSEKYNIFHRLATGKKAYRITVCRIHIYV